MSFYFCRISGLLHDKTLWWTAGRQRLKQMMFSFILDREVCLEQYFTVQMHQQPASFKAVHVTVACLNGYPCWFYHQEQIKVQISHFPSPAPSSEGGTKEVPDFYCWKLSSLHWCGWDGITAWSHPHAAETLHPLCTQGSLVPACLSPVQQKKHVWISIKANKVGRTGARCVCLCWTRCHVPSQPLGIV